MGLHLGLGLTGQRVNASPAPLFTVAGSRGFMFDLSNYATQWQDTGATVPITSTAQSVARVDDLSGLGNHATQATAGSRPLTTTIGAGYRGIQFDGVDDWLQTAAIDFAGAEVLGSELVTNGDFSAGGTWTLNTGWSISAGQLVGLAVPAFSLAAQPISVVAGRAYKVTYTVVTATAGGVRPVFLNGTQISGITQTAAGTYSEVFFAVSGNNQFAIQATSGGFSGTIDNVSVKEVITSADEVTVVAGVRKLSDAAGGMVVELGAPTATQSFQLRAPSGATADFAFASTGTTATVFAASPSTFAAPNSSVLSGQGKTGANTSILRRNGTQVATSATVQGAGNYSNAIVYIGRRGGTSLPFNGVLTFLFAINRLLTANELASVEAYANARTGAY